MLNNWINQFSNIVILKTGQQETFVEDSGEEISLGDVIRSTAILRSFNLNQKVLWLTSQAALPLVQESSNVTKKIFSIAALNELSQNRNTLLINLEQAPQLLSIIDKFSHVVGFVAAKNCNSGNWLIKDYWGELFSLNEWKAHCANENIKTWGASLQRLVGNVKSISYGVFLRPQIEPKYDIGLNCNVGNKWPSKTAGLLFWQRIESQLQGLHTISWQKGLNSLEEYIAWIASNKLIISLDSLGLHLAMAMEIPAIGLFGATDATYFDLSPKVSFIEFDKPNDSYLCIPCWKKHCHQKVHCSEHLSFHKLQSALNLLRE